MAKRAWRIKNDFEGIHSCVAVALTCLDFRYWEKAVYFIKEILRIWPFDFPSLPGATKHFSEQLGKKCIEIPVEVHDAKKIILIHHQGCAAYADQTFPNDFEEQWFHETELRKTKKAILGKYKDKEVIMVFIRLVEEEKYLEFLIVEDEKEIPFPNIETRLVKV